MTIKSKRNLYLYLAIACFIGIIVIFVDSYLGIHDTIYFTLREREWTVGEVDYSIKYVGGDEKVFFRYELDNRRLLSYSTSIQASVWKENEKVLDLFSQDKLIIMPFDKAMVEWTLDPEELQSQGFYTGDYTEYTVKVERNGVEWRISVTYR